MNEEDKIENVEESNSPKDTDAEHTEEIPFVEAEQVDSTNFNGSIMGNNLGDLFNRIGSTDYSPILEQFLKAFEQLENNNQVLKNEIDKHSIQIKALTLFTKISGCIALTSLIILIIHMIFVK